MKWFAILLIVPTILLGTDLKPWFPPDYEFQGSVNQCLQYYRTIKSPHKPFRNHTLDSFTTFSIEISGYDSCGELETTLAHSHRQSFGFDNIRFTARYLLLNDSIGDVVSATAGITVIQALKNSLRDPSSFHHGTIEAEFHLALGQEMPCGSIWGSRWWALVGIGSGDHGSPWIHGHFEWEKNWWNTYRLSLFLESLWGLGKRSFSLPFRGYGSIRHQSIDLGGRYTHIFENGLQGSLEYVYRFYALNFPQNANRCEIKFLYPFSL